MFLKRFLFTFAFIIFSVLLYLYITVFSQPSLEKDLRSQYLKGGDFKLLHNETPFFLNQLKGRPVILYFGYTSCPDVCPVGLAVIRDVLRSSEAFNDVPAVFVTLDPERDSTKKLQEYVSFFHENIIPLRGEVEEIRKVIEAYGGFFRKVASENAKSGDYLVDHSAYYYLIDSKGELVRVFDHSVSSKELAESLRSAL